MDKTLKRLRKVEKILAKENRRIRESSRPNTSQSKEGGSKPFDLPDANAPVVQSEEVCRPQQVHRDFDLNKDCQIVKFTAQNNLY